MPLVLPWLPADAAAAAPAASVASALCRVHPIVEAGSSLLDAFLLLDGELSDAGDRAETVLADAIARVRPGGLVAVAVPNAVTWALHGGRDDGRRRFTAAQLEHVAEHFGCEVHLLCAPGAAATVAGRPWRGVDDVALDRTPGLLDAGPAVLAVVTTPPDPATRSARFFATVPRKVVATAVVCHDDVGRLLVVHDTFRRAWTVPGGVVDADEPPAAAAVREAWEEAGVRVRLRSLLGAAAASWPDRVVLYYGAEPVAPEPNPEPVHVHEVDEVAWLPVDVALARLQLDVAADVRRCLDSPGGTWHR